MLRQLESLDSPDSLACLDAHCGRRDLRLAIADLYVCRGEGGIVFALTINTPRTEADTQFVSEEFHSVAQYAINLDLNGDAREDLTFRVKFGERDGAGRQAVELRRLDRRSASDPAIRGTLIGAGATDAAIVGHCGVRLWAGHAVDPFVVEPMALAAAQVTFKQGARVDLSRLRPCAAPRSRAAATVRAIVIEVPDAELTWRLPDAWSQTPWAERSVNFTLRLPPEQRIYVWPTTLLATSVGDWQQFSRAGRPLIQRLFEPDSGVECSELASQYNATAPAEDRERYSEWFARRVPTVALSEDPQAYREAVAAALLPDVLPYLLGDPASHGFAGHNGRALTVNSADVMLSSLTNTWLAGEHYTASDGATCDKGCDKAHDTFPYNFVADRED
jgi:hypothetical protein